MKQAEKVYMISDAAKQVKVESHVLRYWEEELKLPIKRNEMGHRYYTEEDVNRFKDIKDLKEQGLQLKAIRSMLKTGTLKSPVGAVMPEPQTEEKKEAVMYHEEENAKRHVMMINKGEFVPIHEDTREAKNIRLQQLLQNMIMDAVRFNNKEVCDEIKESLLKELGYQFRLQEEREDERDEQRITRQEEYYRQIDELIRSRNRRKRLGRKKLKEEEGNKPKTEEMEVEVLEPKVEKREGGVFLRKKRSIT